MDNNIIQSIYDTIHLESSSPKQHTNCENDNYITKSQNINSWINQYDRLCSITSNQEREISEYIKFYFIYINKNNYIDKVLFEKGDLDVDFENNFSYISKESLLKIIQSKKIIPSNILESKTPFSRYKLIDILSFVVDIEPENIQWMANDETIEHNTFGSLKVLSLFKDIHIHKSIFVFHNINSIYFIFQEVDCNNFCGQNKSSSRKFRDPKDGGHSLNRFTIRSILKKENLSSQKNGITKKVRISIPGEENNKGGRFGHRTTKRKNS
jgi:hypothetical protein